jgi:trimeric autotransporter adhesin
MTKARDLADNAEGTKTKAVGTANDTAARLAVGTDTYILSANSAEATGLQWIANDTGDIEGVVTGTDSGLSGGVIRHRYP